MKAQNSRPVGKLYLFMVSLGAVASLGMGVLAVSPRFMPGARHLAWTKIRHSPEFLQAAANAGLDQRAPYQVEDVKSRVASPTFLGQVTAGLSPANAAAQNKDSPPARTADPTLRDPVALATRLEFGLLKNEGGIIVGLESTERETAEAIIHGISARFEAEEAAKIQQAGQELLATLEAQSDEARENLGQANQAVASLAAYLAERVPAQTRPAETENPSPPHHSPKTPARQPKARQTEGTPALPGQPGGAGGGDPAHGEGTSEEPAETPASEPEPEPEPAPPVRNPRWEELHRTLQELLQRRAQMIARLQPEHPLVRDIDLQINELNQLMQGVPEFLQPVPVPNGGSSQNQPAPLPQSGATPEKGGPASPSARLPRPLSGTATEEASSESTTGHEAPTLAPAANAGETQEEGDGPSLMPLGSLEPDAHVLLAGHWQPFSPEAAVQELETRKQAVVLAEDALAKALSQERTVQESLDLVARQRVLVSAPVSVSVRQRPTFYKYGLFGAMGLGFLVSLGVVGVAGSMQNTVFTVQEAKNSLPVPVVGVLCSPQDPALTRTWHPRKLIVAIWKRGCELTLITALAILCFVYFTQ